MSNHTPVRLQMTPPPKRKFDLAGAVRSLTAPNALLWKMAGVAVGIHILLMLFTSHSLFGSKGESVDELYDRGDRAMKAGHYTEATEIFQHVLDAQPKAPPVFAKAADQHRNAERMAKQQAGVPLTPAVAPTPVTPAKTSPTPAIPDTTPTAPKPATLPTDIPNELRPR